MYTVQCLDSYEIDEKTQTIWDAFIFIYIRRSTISKHIKTITFEKENKKALWKGKKENMYTTLSFRASL